MTRSIDRRRFLGTAAATGAMAMGMAPSRRGANETVIVGVMGTGGRGTGHARNFERLEGAEVAYVCDVDRKRAEGAAAAVQKVNGKAKPVTDYRRMLEDKGIDALVVATTDHWHAPAAIAAVAAGKHVYVEKPCSHNAREGELLVEAARKHKKVVQMGNQRRSWPKVIEGIEAVKAGEVGNVHYSRAWYANTRGSIGKGKAAPVPDGLDFDLWQGPAPRRPYRDNILHYKWHWFWHWGTGEAGNNGVHAIDLCRWGLGVDYPVRVSSTGGRYFFDDDQESPDTHVLGFEFEGNKSITWEGMSCNRFGQEGTGFGVTFQGDKGSLLITGAGYTLFDRNRKEVRKVAGPGGDEGHLQNFLEGIRGRQKLNSEIGEGHKTTLLCHLGNIAYRTGRSLACDPSNGHIRDDAEATKLWSREYEPGWEPKV